MKIYTRRGDSGHTGIWGGARLPKDDLRIEAIGSVDECNAAVGAAIAEGIPDLAANLLAVVQNSLFVVGSDLMAPDHTGPGTAVPRIGADDVARLETEIDNVEATLPELRNFILPGGTRAAAHIHLARAVCRRAERQVTALNREAPVGGSLLAYLNRLSDLFFVIARYVNASNGVGDVVWSGG
jgi:cob(I)alamin adenosyltransferase